MAMVDGEAAPQPPAASFLSTETSEGIPQGLPCPTGLSRDLRLEPEPLLPLWGRKSTKGGQVKTCAT